MGGGGRTRWVLFVTLLALGEQMFDHGGMAAEPALALRDPAGASAALRELAERIRPVELRSQQPTLAVVPGLEPLLPEGLVKGTTVAVGSAAGVGGATTLALALAAGPSRAGAWVALVGGDGGRNGGGSRGGGGGSGSGGGSRGGSGGGSRGGGGEGGGMWGLVAAAGLGVALERLVVVAPGDRPVSGWGPVVAALVEGFPIVVVGPRVPLRPGDGRRLAARLRERGGVLVRVGDASVPSSAHVRLRVTEGEWQGVEAGAGYLRSRRVVVEATGRGAASRLRRCELLLPGPTGEIVATED